MVGKLRHIAISVPNKHEATRFYQNSFGMKLIRENETLMASVAYLSDGLMSLALIEYKSDTAAGKATSPKNEGKEFVGLYTILDFGLTILREQKGPWNKMEVNI